MYKMLYKLSCTLMATLGVKGLTFTAYCCIDCIMAG